MERRISKTVNIDEIIFDEDLYPRTGYNWQTGYIYSQAMESGAKFPPITLAFVDRKLILVDGKHRLEAMKLLKKNTIDAEVFTGWNRRRMFEEAVRRNISHGRVLSPYEKRLIALKLRGLEFKDNQISEIIQVPQDKLQNFIQQRLVNSITGETIKEVVVKKELQHLSGKDYTEDELQEVIEAQTPMDGKSQLNLINSLIKLVEDGLLNLKDKEVKERFEYLKQLVSQ